MLTLANGLSYGAILYLVAIGLSLTFGVGRFLNLAHGGFYLLAGYAAISVSNEFGFWTALVVVPLGVMALAAVVERLLLRRWAGEHFAIEQLLLTFGLAFVLADVVREYSGGVIRSMSPPPLLSGAVDLGVARFPIYRGAIIVVAILVAIAVHLTLSRTTLGATIRAAAADRSGADALGLDTDRILGRTYVVGVGLAAFAGVIATPVIAAAPRRDFAILILALIVVVVSGLGNANATFWGAMLVGLVETYGRSFAPRFAELVLYALLAVVLVVRPGGLFVPRSAT